MDTGNEALMEDSAASGKTPSSKADSVSFVEISPLRGPSSISKPSRQKQHSVILTEIPKKLALEEEPHFVMWSRIISVRIYPIIK